VILNNFAELIEILPESVKMKKGEKFLHNTSNFYQEAKEENLPSSVL